MADGSGRRRVGLLRDAPLYWPFYEGFALFAGPVLEHAATQRVRDAGARALLALTVVVAVGVAALVSSQVIDDGYAYAGWVGVFIVVHAFPGRSLRERRQRVRVGILRWVVGAAAFSGGAIVAALLAGAVLLWGDVNFSRWARLSCGCGAIYYSVQAYAAPRIERHAREAGD